MSSKGRTELFSVSDFAESRVWLSPSNGIALVFWNLRKTAIGFKCLDLGRFLRKMMLEKAYMFPICCTFGSRNTCFKVRPGFLAMPIPVSYRHFPRWRT